MTTVPAPRTCFFQDRSIPQDCWQSIALSGQHRCLRASQRVPKEEETTIRSTELVPHGGEPPLLALRGRGS